VPVIVAVEFRLPDNRRRDVQNLLHPGLFDALKTLTVIVDDSAQWMSLEVSSVVDGTRRTVIRIREREEENKPGRKGGQA
jgi:Holliday junction resolvase RusA-like endonuclease